MAQAQVLTDIANLALLSLGEGVIQNIEDTGDTEIIMNRAISEVIRQVQLMIHWPELIKTSTPTQAADMFDSTRYRYNLPSSLLEIVRVLYSNGADVEDWEIIEGKLVTSATSVSIHYKFYTEEVSKWSPRMTEVIYRKLALECCMQVAPASMQTVERAYELAKKESLSKIRSRSRNYKKNRNTFGYNQLRRGSYIHKPIGYR